MKKIVLIFIVFLTTVLYGHKQSVHIYLTQQGYYLLKDYYNGTSIRELEEHLGHTPISSSWTNKSLIAGAWLEDEEDVVYGYSAVTIPLLDSWATSVSHFWEADNGDNSSTTLRLERNLGTLGPYPNAYQKIKAYAYPNKSWEIKYKFPNQTVITFTRPNNKFITLTTVQIGIKYSSLPELYNTGRAWITGWVRISTGQWVNCDYEVILSPSFRDKFVWEILGRMCHLLQDMSVPAHAHMDEHGLSKDDYEEWISENNHFSAWQHTNVGSLLNPLISNNPLHFLMYTTQQIADHFGSSGPYQGTGDNNISGNYSNEEYTYLNNIGLNTQGDPMGMGPFVDSTCKNIRDKTFPQVIRATAGLLYWFVNECNLAPIPLSEVSISGPTTMYNEGKYQFFVTLKNGKGPFTYTWQKRFVDDINMFSYRSPILRSAPSNSWISIGTNSNTLTLTPSNNGDWRDFELRCIVKDLNGNVTKTSNTLYVKTINTQPPTSKVTSGETTSLSTKMATETETEEIDKVSVSNYPNPFNPTTTINYQIPESGFVSLKVYNSLGKEVATLANEVKAAGSYKAVFNASDFASGVYYSRLQVNGFVKTSKMLLVK